MTYDFWTSQLVEREGLVSKLKAIAPEWLDAAMVEADRRRRQWRCGTVAALRSVYRDIAAAKWSPPQLPEHRGRGLGSSAHRPEPPADNSGWQMTSIGP
jgi:hypothetical protein